MKLHADRVELLRAAEAASKFCGRRSVNPVLEHLLLSCEGGLAEVVGTDLSRAARVAVDHERVALCEDGLCLLPAGRLIALLQNSSADVARVEVAEGATKAKLKLGKSCSTLATESPASFPTLNRFPESVGLTVAAGEFSRAVAASRAVIGDDDCRFSFHLVNLEVGEDSLFAYASDGKGLMRFELEASSIDPSAVGRHLLSGRDLAAADRLGRGPVEISIGGRMTFLRNGRSVVAVAQRAGRYPPVEHALDKQPEHRMAVELQDLQMAVAQAIAVLDQDDNSLYLQASGGQITVAASSTLGEVAAPVEAEGDAEMQIEMPPARLAKILRAIDGEKVEVGLRTPREQVRLVGVGGRAEFVLMPILQGPAP